MSALAEMFLLLEVKIDHLCLRKETLANLTPKEKIRKECDGKATNIILHGLPNGIYTFLNHKTKAYDICYRVKELIEGRELTNQDRESKLANEFDRFTLEKGETIKFYYMRYAKLMNDINTIGLNMTKLQEARLELDDEEQDFMADGLEGFDSDYYDEAPISSTIFMTRLSPTRSVNGDDVGPFYDTDILSEKQLSAEHAYWLPVSNKSVVDVKPEKAVRKQL
ncbi:hypothetical protein Tco_1270691 [Tanacetum coccineum]